MALKSEIWTGKVFARCENTEECEQFCLLVYVCACSSVSLFTICV